MGTGYTLSGKTNDETGGSIGDTSNMFGGINKSVNGIDPNYLILAGVAALAFYLMGRK